jgi:hypothetical protein
MLATNFFNSSTDTAGVIKLSPKNSAAPINPNDSATASTSRGILSRHASQ